MTNNQSACASFKRSFLILMRLSFKELKEYTKLTTEIYILKIIWSEKLLELY